MPEQELIGTVEAAEILGLSLPTLKRRARSGDVPVVKKLGPNTGAYVFDRAVLEAIRDQPTEVAS